MSDLPTPIEKTMSLTPAEFALSAARLSAHDVVIPGMPVDLACGAGRVRLTCEPLPEVRLGGLLALPRATVRITFEGVTADDRQAFLRRFDLAFQRGGG